MSSHSEEPWLSAIKNDPRTEEQMRADYVRNIAALKESNPRGAPMKCLNVQAIEDIILTDVLDLKKPERAGSYLRELAKKAAEKIAQAVHLPAAPVKRPVAFRVPRADPSAAGEMYGVEWRLFQDEEAAREEADALGVEYQGLYSRD